jgi:ABC-type transporter Mla maintaining outer membrane lipid asymmetry permease subunit MlaE
MKYSSARRERLILADPMDSRLRRKATFWDHINAALNDSDLIVIVLFCTLGLLATLGLYVLFPDFGALAASLQAFL